MPLDSLSRAASWAAWEVGLLLCSQLSTGEDRPFYSAPCVSRGVCGKQSFSRNLCKKMQFIDNRFISSFTAIALNQGLEMMRTARIRRKERSMNAPPTQRARGCCRSFRFQDIETNVNATRRMPNYFIFDFSHQRGKIIQYYDELKLIATHIFPSYR